MEPTIPPPTADVIENVMDAGGIGGDQRKTVEEGLAFLREEYLRACANLGYYATDKQLTNGLTSVKNRAARLRDTLEESHAVRYELMKTALETFPGDNISDRGQADEVCTALERDIEAAGRLHDLASKALTILDERIRHWPNEYAKPTAQKPEDEELGWGILRLWSEPGRAEKGRDAAALLNFTCRTLEYIWQRPEINPDTATDLLKRAWTEQAAIDSPE